MKTSVFLLEMGVIGALGMLCVTAAAGAGAAGGLQSEVRHMDRIANAQGAVKVQNRLATEFGSFAGSDANAQSLVTGLRSGTSITLTSTSTSATGTPTVNTSTFNPPTRPMGFGNVFISLALAKQQLASNGITDPTPQQIQAALTGGTITTSNGTVTLKGVLTQRADGMGWGAIANAQGVKLGQVVSGLKRTNTQFATSATAGASAGTTTATNAGTQTHVTTATGASAPGNSANAPGHSRDVVTGSGTVTATGASVGTGIVNASGAAVTVHGGTNAQGQGRGLLKH